jgi:glutamate-1-semialdehyde 2,1-aminomutase
MKLVAPEGPMYQAGTLSGNPAAMEAGYQTLLQLQNWHARQQLTETADWFTNQLRPLVSKFKYSLVSIGTMFTIFFTSTSPTSFAAVEKTDTAAFRAWYRETLQGGLYLSPSPFETHFLSTAHTKRQLSQALTVMERAFETAQNQGAKS